MGILSVDLNNINLDDINSNEGDPKTVIHVRIMDWHNSLSKVKHLKR